METARVHLVRHSSVFHSGLCTRKGSEQKTYACFHRTQPKDLSSPSRKQWHPKSHGSADRMSPNLAPTPSSPSLLSSICYKRECSLSSGFQYIIVRWISIGMSFSIPVEVWLGPMTTPRLDAQIEAFWWKWLEEAIIKHTLPSCLPNSSGAWNLLIMMQAYRLHTANYPLCSENFAFTWSCSSIYEEVQSLQMAAKTHRLRKTLMLYCHPWGNLRSTMLHGSLIFHNFKTKESSRHTSFPPSSWLGRLVVQMSQWCTARNAGLQKTECSHWILSQFTCYTSESGLHCNHCYFE